FERFLKICASQIGQLLNYTTIANDCGIDQKTVKAWLSVLEANYIVFQVRPHFKHFRKRLTKSSKLYFYDVGFAAYCLGISSPDHVASHPLRGLLFENFVVAECIKHRYNNIKDNNIYFYRDHVGSEVDIILDHGDKLYSVEVKVSETMHYDFLKGLKHYHQIAGDTNSKQFLVYGGDQQFTTKDVFVYGYRDIDAMMNSCD
ncbi:MAG: DUF4143 domain-containing protein, partial [Coxiellaceae bacterium]|nr:DUF4143 domain-containing protein [Coxiellaceae bacterium]